jgi:hypothetical protein
MGGSTTQVRQTSSQTQPWAPAQPLVGGILGQLGGALDNTALTANESAALGGLEANASAGNPWAPQIGALASDLLRGGGPDRTGLVSGAYDAYKSALAPFARGDLVDPASNPALQGYLDTIGTDVSSRVNGMFAGAGRDLSGMNTQTLARGIAQGEAPVLSQAYDTARAQQLAAIDKLYGAGGQTAGLLSNLDQTALANRQAGVGVADAALAAQNYGLNQTLALEAMRRGIPLEALQRIAAIGVPIAGLGQSSTGTTTDQTQVPLADKLAGYAAMALALAGKTK